MYEDKKFKLNINWKSLLIKLGILLIGAFVICFIVFRPKNEIISLANNVTSLKTAAIKYYKNNLSLKEIGDYDKVSLKELIEVGLLKKQNDEAGNSCSNKNSYAYLTKVRDTEYILKIYMECGDNQESQVFNLTNKDLTVVASTKEETKEEESVIEDKPIKKENILVEYEDAKNETNNKKEDKNELADNSINNKKEEANKETINFGNDKLVEEIHNPNSNKVVRYKHIKYGEWKEGNKTGDNIENSTKVVTYYKYCKDNNCVTDRVDNLLNYEGYTATYSHKGTVSIYRYIFVVWSNSTCIEGFINTGIAELR